MESRDYEKILNSMPETGVCVIRESDHALLYFNQLIGALVPRARLGEPCAELCEGIFGVCLENAAVRERFCTCGTSDVFGGTVDITAVKTRWENEDPAIVLTVTPMADAGRGTQRNTEQSKLEAQMAAILRSRFKMMNTVHLDTGVCERVILSPDTQPGPAVVGDYESYINRALEGFVHPEDAQTFRDTLSLEHMRERANQIQDYAEEVCVYRQRGEPVCWIDLRVIYVRRADGVTAYIFGQDVTREKNQEETNVKALEERAYIIGSLSSLFFATYYVDLEHDSFRTVTQQRKVGDVLGDEVNCTAALQIYANHFIHPDDREEYLRVMNVDNMIQELRWWQPCVAVEYRKLSGGPDNSWDWVRATAVLARTGSDDMPKTAVYVAQNISEGRHGQQD